MGRNAKWTLVAATTTKYFCSTPQRACCDGGLRHAFNRTRGHLITGCADGWIYIIDVETGLEVWSVKTDNTIYTVPLVAEDKAYIGSTDKYLYVLDLDGRTVKAKIFAGSKIFGPPRLLQGRIYFGACNGIVYEMDPSTDEVTGAHQLPDAITSSDLQRRDGRFLRSTYVNELFAEERNIRLFGGPSKW